MRTIIHVLGYLVVLTTAVVLSISSRPIVPETGRENLAFAIYRQFPMAERLVCAGRGHRSSPEADTLALAIAIADVESYARPGWVRFLKDLYLATYQVTFGQFPDMSSGPAQIRITNIKRIAGLADSASLGLILNECDNISVAYCLVSELRDGRSLTADNVAAIARSYNGQTSSAKAEASLQYVDLIQRIFILTKIELDNFPVAGWEFGVVPRHICL
jgi:hypothetical protein